MILALVLPLTILQWAVVWPTLHLSTALTAMSDGMLSSAATVSEVERGLAQDPADWSGRIVLVRGRAARYVAWQAPDSLVTQVALVDPERVQSTLPLSLTWGRPDPLLAALRRLPLLGPMVQPMQRLHAGTTAVYRVQLCAPAGRAHGCAGAVLLDADPADFTLD
jgi:hypothetical protein